MLRNILTEPERYFEDNPYGKIAESLTKKAKLIEDEIGLNKEGVAYNIFGAEHFEDGAVAQMINGKKFMMVRK